MKQMLKGFLSIALLVSSVATQIFAEDVTGQPFFAGRPQVNHWNRVVAGMGNLFPRCDLDCFGGVGQAIVGYSRNFDQKSIGKFFSPDKDKTNTFRVGAAGRPDTDVINTNFLLGDGYESDVTLKPRIENAFIDLNFHLQLNEWVCGLWFEAHAPINWVRTSMDFDESTTNQGNTSISSGKLGTTSATSPFNTFADAWKGKQTVANTFVKSGMDFARVEGRQTKWALADLELALGYDFICNECSFMGVSLRVIAPTGNRPDGEFVFEPISGSGKHTQVGGGLHGYYEFWNNCCDSSFGLFFDAHIYTMLKKTQKRTFDWKNNGKWSRYLLLKKFNDSNMQTGDVIPGTNITTVDADVKASANGEAVIMLDYQRCGFVMNVGYDIWGRSKEKICIKGEISEKVGIVGVIDGTTNATTVDSVYVQNDATICSKGTPTIFAKGLTIDDLDVEGAAHPSALSHKIFGYLGYTWEDCDYMPFMGIGGEGEFSGRDNKAFDQWAIWFKGGFAFS